MTRHETDFYQKLRAKFPGGCHWLRIENLVSSGAPDCNVCHDGRTRWLELKIVKGGRIEVRWSQLQWVLKRVYYAHASDVWFAAPCPTDDKKVWAWAASVIWARAQGAKMKGEKGEKFQLRSVKLDKDSITFAPGPPTLEKTHEQFSDFLFSAESDSGLRQGKVDLWTI